MMFSINDAGMAEYPHAKRTSEPTCRSYTFHKKNGTKWIIDLKCKIIRR